MTKRIFALLLALALLCLSGAAWAEEAASAYPSAGAEGVTLTFAKIAQTQITSQYDSLQDTPLLQAYICLLYTSRCV